MGRKAYTILLLLLVYFSAYSSRLDSLNYLLSISSPTDKESYVDVLNQLAEEHTKNDYNIAFDYAQRALEAATAMGYVKGALVAKDHLGYVYENQGEFDKALSLYESNLEAYRQIGDWEGIKGSYENLGWMSFCKGDFQAMRLHFEEALKIGEQHLEDLASVARTKNYLAMAWLHLNNYVEAKSSSLASLHLRKSINDYEGISYCYLFLGDLESHLNEFQKAYYYYELAEETIHEHDIKNAYIIFRYHLGLAEIYKKNSAYNLAEVKLRQALQIAEKLSTEALLEVYLSLAQVKKEVDAWEEAILYLKKIVEKKELTKQTVLSKAYYELGNLYVQKGDFQQGELYLDYALQLGMSLHDYSLLKKTAYDLKTIYKAQNRDADAVNMGEFYEQMGDSAHQYTLKQELAKQDYLFVKERRRDEQQDELAMQRNIIIGISGLCLLLFFLVVITFRHYRYKSWVIKESKRQSRELRIKKKVLAKRAAELDLKNKELTESNLELEEANDRLEKFASFVSHDLKQPLGNIIGFADLLQEEATELSESSRDYVATILHSAEEMERLITGLLHYSRLGSYVPRTEYVQLPTILYNIQKNLAFEIRKKQAKIEYDLDLPTIHANPILIQQLFDNLIKNAIKYSQPDVPPVVKIGQVKLQGVPCYYVSDNGVGMEADDLERVFGLFVRLHVANDNHGSGIGLAICKKIVDLYNGKIWVESTPDKGSTFYFTLPKAQIVEDTTPLLHKTG